MISLPRARHVPHALPSAARFAVVGLLGTLVDFSLFFAAQLFLNLPMLAANILSYSAGIVNNYTLHRAWTFALRPRRAIRRQFAVFVGVSLVALAINSLVVNLLGSFLTLHLPNPALAAVLAKICATAAGISWNFFANHVWTFGN